MSCSTRIAHCNCPLEGDDEHFQEWRREHLASGECDINFNGSSPAMEVEGASILWRRSIELHNMRYKLERVNLFCLLSLFLDFLDL